jgi:hypothetical protein
MTKEINKKINYFIKIKTLTKELEFKAPKTKKNSKMTKNGAPGISVRLQTKYDIYKLILGFHNCQVGRVLSITLKHDFLRLIGTSVLDRTICALGRTYSMTSNALRRTRISLLM